MAWFAATEWPGKKSVWIKGKKAKGQKLAVGLDKDRRLKTRKKRKQSSPSTKSSMLLKHVVICASLSAQAVRSISNSARRSVSFVFASL